MTLVGTNEIRPIETVFKGCRFRSRLEARWAVFFQTLGVRWVYEPEGYELPSGRYLPDFQLDSSRVGGFLWVEVKPDRPAWPAGFVRAWDLARLSGIPVWFLCGQPWPGRHEIVVVDPLRADQEMPGEEDFWAYNCLTECRRCSGWCLLANEEWGEFSGYCDVGLHECGDHDKMPLPPSDLYARPIHHAYAVAQAARFEHGERGATHV
jgi:hypothetical protein